MGTYSPSLIPLGGIEDPFPFAQAPTSLYGIEEQGLGTATPASSLSSMATPDFNLETSFGRQIPTYETGLAPEPARLAAPSNIYPNFGQRLLRAIGGPQAVQSFVEQHVRGKLIPVQNEFTSRFREAVRVADFDTAYQLINDLQRYSYYAPGISKLVEGATTFLQQQEDKVTRKKSFIDTVGGEVKANSSFGRILARAYDDPGVSLEDLKPILDIAIPKGEISETALTTYDRLSQKAERTPLPVTQKTGDLTSEENAAATSLGIPKTLIVNLRNKISTGKASSEEKQALEIIERHIEETATNLKAAQVVPAETVLRGRVTDEQRRRLAGFPPARSTQVQPPAPEASVPITIIPSTPQGPLITQEQAQKMHAEVEAFNLPAAQKQAAHRAIDRQLLQSSTPQAPTTPTLSAQDVGPQVAQQAIEQEAAKTRAETRAREEQRYESAPLDPSIQAYKLTSEGNIEIAPEEIRSSQGKTRRANYHIVADPKEQAQIRAYSVMKSEANDLRNTLKNASSEDVQGPALYAARAVANGFYVPVRVPLVGATVPLELPGLGTALTLTREQALIYNKLVAFAQKAEDFLNTSGKDSKYVENAKNTLLGAFANKDQMLFTIRALEEIGYSQVQGLLGITPGAVSPRKTTAEESRELSQELERRGPGGPPNTPPIPEDKRQIQGSKALSSVRRGIASLTDPVSNLLTTTPPLPRRRERTPVDRGVVNRLRGLNE